MTEAVVARRAGCDAIIEKPSCAGSLLVAAEISVGPGGERAVVIGNGASAIWDLTAGVVSRTLGERPLTTHVRWRRDGKRFALADNYFELVDPDSEEPIARDDDILGVTDFRFSPDGRWLVYVNSNGDVVRFDVETGARTSATMPVTMWPEIEWVGDSSAFVSRETFEAKTLKVIPFALGWAVAAPSGSRVAAFNSKGRVSIARLPSAKVEKTFNAIGGTGIPIPTDTGPFVASPIWAATWTSDAKQVMFALADGRIRIYDATSAKLVDELRVGAGPFLADPGQRGFEDETRSVTVSESGRFIVLQDFMGEMELLDRTTRSRFTLEPTRGMADTVHVVAPSFNADETRLFAGFGGAIYDTTTGDKLGETSTFDATFSRGERFLAGTSPDRFSVRIHRMEDGANVDLSAVLTPNGVRIIARSEGLYDGPDELAGCFVDPDYGPSPPPETVERAPGLLRSIWSGDRIASQCSPR